MRSRYQSLMTISMAAQIISCFLLTATCCGQQLSKDDFGPSIEIKLDSDPRPAAPSDRLFIQRLGAGTLDDSNHVYDMFAQFDAGKTTYSVVHLEFKDKASCEAAIATQKHVFASFDRFADVFIEANDASLDEVGNLPGLVWMEVNRSGLVPPPARPTMVEEGAKDPPLDIVQGGAAKLTGKGVTVAVVDTGIDFTHPDFITYDSKGIPESRIAYFWDTESQAYANGIGSPAPIKYPNGSPIGTIFSREDLTREIRGSRPRISVRDISGHGTACAGIAVGNGNVDKRYMGVAPDCDLIAVKVGTGPSLPNTYLIGAICSWLDEVAAERPLVISCSWGGQLGGRDGQSVLERQLSARFAPEVKSRAICFAAGNEGAVSLHSDVKIGSPEKPGVTLFKSAGLTQLMIYVDTDSDKGISIGNIGDNTKVENISTHLNPFTNQLVIEVIVQVAGELGGIYVQSNRGEELPADVYVSPNGSFLPRFAIRGKQLSTPGGALNVLTIGSFDWNDQFNRDGEVVKLTDPVTQMPIEVGKPSTYSNPGPLRMGDAIKPEIAAPGQWYTAATPINISGVRDSTGFYQPFNGTSAATPYVAGIIALMFEKNPGMTFGEVRQQLIDNVSKDANHQSQFGNGKLDSSAVEKLLKAGE